MRKFNVRSKDMHFPIAYKVGPAICLANIPNDNSIINNCLEFYYYQLLLSLWQSSSTSVVPSTRRCCRTGRRQWRRLSCRRPSIVQSPHHLLHMAVIPWAARVTTSVMELTRHSTHVPCLLSPTELIARKCHSLLENT